MSRVLNLLSCTTSFMHYIFHAFKFITCNKFLVSGNSEFFIFCSSSLFPIFFSFRYTECNPTSRAYLKYAKWEEKQFQFGLARGIFIFYSLFCFIMSYFLLFHLQFGVMMICLKNLALYLLILQSSQ